MDGISEYDWNNDSGSDLGPNWSDDPWNSQDEWWKGEVEWDEEGEEDVLHCSQGRYCQGRSIHCDQGASSQGRIDEQVLSEKVGETVKLTGTPPWLWPEWNTPKLVVAKHDAHIWQDQFNWDGEYKGVVKAGDLLIVDQYPSLVDGFWMMELMNGEGAVEAESFKPTNCTRTAYGHNLIVDEIDDPDSASKRRKQRQRQRRKQMQMLLSFAMQGPGPIETGRYSDTCLITALRSLGVKCAYDRDGPLWALRDGNDILKTHKKCLKHVPRPRNLPGGRYVVHMDAEALGHMDADTSGCMDGDALGSDDGHFFAVRTFEDDFEIIDGGRLIRLEGEVHDLVNFFGGAATWYALDEAVTDRPFKGLPIALCMEINSYLAPDMWPEMLHRVTEGGPVTYPLLGSCRALPFVHWVAAQARQRSLEHWATARAGQLSQGGIDDDEDCTDEEGDPTEGDAIGGMDGEGASSQDSRPVSSQDPVASDSQSSFRGLVRRMQSKDRLQYSSSAASSSAGPGPRDNKSIQCAALEMQKDMVTKFVLSTWPRVGGCTSTDEQDIATAIGIIKHSIVSSITSGKASIRDHLFMLLLRYGSALRVHEGELFQYLSGVWVNIKDPPLLDMRDACTIAEGLFHTLADDIDVEVDTWKWEKVAQRIKSIVTGYKDNGAKMLKDAMIAKAKAAWDINRKSTGGKVYNAKPLAKMADAIAARAKEFFESDLPRKDKSQLLRLYTGTCQTPMPKSNGWRFSDKYMDSKWQEKPDSPENNCYTALPYPRTPKESDCPPGMSIKDVRAFLDTFIKSHFWENDQYFATTVSSLYAAFHRLETGIMNNGVGDGGDGKGMFDIMQMAVVGENNSATLEPNVFIEPGEFRKSGHFAFAKLLVVINESKGRSNFEYDIWKRFVVGEPIDVRCNFGQTVKMKFKGVGVLCHSLNVASRTKWRADISEMLVLGFGKILSA
jgi:hypothetical protein